MNQNLLTFLNQMHATLGYVDPSHETYLLVKESIDAALDDLRWASATDCSKEEAEARVTRAFSILDSIRPTPAEINHIHHREY